MSLEFHDIVNQDFNEKSLLARTFGIGTRVLPYVL